MTTTAISIAQFCITPGIEDSCQGIQFRLDFLDRLVAKFKAGDYGRGDSDYGIYTVPFQCTDSSFEVWISHDPDSEFPLVYLALER